MALSESVRREPAEDGPEAAILIRSTETLSLGVLLGAGRGDCGGRKIVFPDFCDALAQQIYSIGSLPPQATTECQ